MRYIIAHQRYICYNSYKAADTAFQIAYKNEPCSQTPGRKNWLLFSIRDMSWGP